MRTLITQIRLIDPAVGQPVENAWLLISDGLIEARGIESLPLPDADVILDGSGCSLLPGLFNLHVHIQRRHLAIKGQTGAFRMGAPAIENSPDTRRMVWTCKNAWRELLSGVTTLRNCGSKGRVDIAFKQLIADKIINGPSMLACGYGIATTGGHETHRYQGAVEVDGPDAVRAAVRAEIKAGADLVKFMGSGGIGGMPEHEDPDWVEMGVDELTAGVQEAHNRGKKTTVHAMGSGAILNALHAGIDCIEHGVNLNDEAIDIMKRRKVHYVPTLSGIAEVAERERRSGSRELADLIQHRVVEPLQNSIRLAAEHGITIGCGTDTVGDVVTELMMLNQCGLSVIDCLRAATSNAAEICGLSGQRGTLAAGQEADILVVRGNPLDQLADLRSVQWVFKKGTRVDASWLINL